MSHCEIARSAIALMEVIQKAPDAAVGTSLEVIFGTPNPRMTELYSHHLLLRELIIPKTPNRKIRQLAAVLLKKKVNRHLSVKSIECVNWSV